MTQPYECSALALTQAYRTGDLTPSEALDSVLARMDRCEPKVNAYCHRDDESARRAAEESTNRWRAGRPQGALDGVPVSVKDLIDVAGMPTRSGSRATAAGPVVSDSPCVAGLRRNGAIILGKTTTPEFGHKGVTDNLLNGVTRNPWNTDMTPGGSSGGAGAALAAGMGPLAVGTDGGGSCRKPANYCGVVGMKPSFGRVPLAGTGGSWPLSSPGPMARTVGDAALLLGALSDPNHTDPFLLPSFQAADTTAPNIKGVRIAQCLEMGGANARPEIASGVSACVAAFRELGATVETAAPDIPDSMPFYRTLFDSGSALTAAQWSEAQLDLADPTFRAGVERGRALSAIDLRRALQQRGELAAAMARFLDRHDLLVLPCNPTTAYQLGQREPTKSPSDTWSATVCFTAPFNITGQPAITVPCGHTTDGLPYGLQIVGRYGEDELVLRAAAAFESTTGLSNQMAPL